jgi:translation initiation factor 2 beta subunit (eIF-2beta)/eIF-5
MQDWISDPHEAFEQKIKTAAELYAEEFDTCTTCEQIE